MIKNSWDITDEISKKLSGLFEKYGFIYVKTGQFEDYLLYEDNKSFFESSHIITVPSSSGKMLALKPDITISIAKNISENRLNAFEKVYYIDDIYRFSQESAEYSIVKQIGVELMGDTDGYSNIEVTNLAIESLRAVDEDYILDISHSNFLTSLLNRYAVSHDIMLKIMDAMHHKSVNDVAEILSYSSAASGLTGVINQLILLDGSFKTSLGKIKHLIANDEMQTAYNELEAVDKLIELLGVEDKVNLDFSVSGDVDYYNGLVFAGYIKGISNKVLSGGRYDKLMERLSKDNGALGFAVHLSEFQHSAGLRENIFDTMIFYDDSSDYTELIKITRKLTAEGKKVRTEHISAQGSVLKFKYTDAFFLKQTKLIEI